MERTSKETMRILVFKKKKNKRKLCIKSEPHALKRFRRIEMSKKF